MTPAWGVLLALWCYGAVAVAQEPGPPDASRLRLVVGADTNDPLAYEAYGRRILALDRLEDQMAQTESALVWAARLDPGSAAPLYQRGIAILRPLLQRAYIDGGDPRRWMEHHVMPERRRQIDSLLEQAWRRDPFLDPDLDPDLVIGLVPLPKYASDPTARGLFAYYHGDLALAARSLSEELQKHPRRLDLRFHRAHLFYQAHRFDSTIVELEKAVAFLIDIDSGHVVAVSPSKEMLYYAIGIAREAVGDTAGARHAYAVALNENLGFYMAHVRLGRILWSQGDTAASLQELSLASDMVPKDPWAHNYYGSALLLAGQYGEAMQQLRTAIAIDPWFSSPYELLGRCLEAVGRMQEAETQYEAFLAHASARDPAWAWATIRVAELRHALADSSLRD